MVLNNQKPHIGIFGRPSVGKTTFINKLAHQHVAIVTDLVEAATQHIYKNIDLGSLGPAIFIDTIGNGIDIIRKCDLAIIVISNNDWGENEKNLAQKCVIENISFFVLHNQSDLASLEVDTKNKIENEYKTEVIEFSCLLNREMYDIINLIQKRLPKEFSRETELFKDLVQRGDLVIMVAPLDDQTSKARFIVPQMQAIRDALDHHCLMLVSKEQELDLVFKKYNLNPKLVITDNDTFLKTQELVPNHIPLTSFNILQTRIKGSFEKHLEGTLAISKLKKGDRVIMIESCAHHFNNEDLGKVLIPKWIENIKGFKIACDITTGVDIHIENIDQYSMLIHCGGAMLSPTQLSNRILPFIEKNIPITNYGLVIALKLGILERALSPFKGIEL